METSSLNINGTPGFWVFMLVHPYLAFFSFCFLVMAIFGTLSDVLTAFANRGKKNG